MGLIMIPENYEELPENLAPICIEDRDQSGKPINSQLIDRGVRPIHAALCHLTTQILRDVGRVSEVVNNAVQGVWRRHGDDFGPQPRNLVYARSKWEAKEIRAGGWAIRRRRQVSLDDPQFVESMDARIRCALLDDPRTHYETRLYLAVLRELAPDEELKTIIELYTHSWTFDEIGALLGRRPNTLVQKFLRWKQLLRAKNI